MTPASAAEILGTYLRDLRARAVAAGKSSDWLKSDVSIHLYADGTGVISIGTQRCGTFSAPLSAALVAAEDYITRDDVALCNLAIGLTPDGRYADAAS